MNSRYFTNILCIYLICEIVPIKTFLFLLAEINPLPPDVPRPQGVKNFDITFYGDKDNNLRPLKSVQYQLVRDLRFYVGVNIGGILRPMFDYQGNMVMVRIRDHETIPMPPGIAKKYRFTIPPWQLELLEAFRLGRKQIADAHPSTSTSSYKQRRLEDKPRHFDLIKQQLPRS